MLALLVVQAGARTLARPAPQLRVGRDRCRSVCIIAVARLDGAKSKAAVIQCDFWLRFFSLFLLSFWFLHFADVLSLVAAKVVAAAFNLVAGVAGVAKLWLWR